jgi:hypothetical protein
MPLVTVMTAAFPSSRYNMVSLLCTSKTRHLRGNHEEYWALRETACQGSSNKSISLTMKNSNGRDATARGRPRSFDREAAFERAMDLFWRHSAEATSISDLTAAMMGMTRPRLGAFGDTKRLFLEAVERPQVWAGKPGPHGR